MPVLLVDSGSVAAAWARRDGVAGLPELAPRDNHVGLTDAILWTPS